MTHLEDTRPIVSYTTASLTPSVIGDDLAQLLLEHPELELASIRLIREDQGVHIVGRVGKLGEPECASCHTHDGHPHTEYCRIALIGDALIAAEIEASRRPDDDPPDEITCDGRNCGGQPHA